MDGGESRKIRSRLTGSSRWGGTKLDTDSVNKWLTLLANIGVLVGIVFLMGVVLGTQFWNTRTLWTTIVTHATYNGLVQFDWRCLTGPRADLRR